jgi:uncharacterized protein YjdB
MKKTLITLLFVTYHLIASSQTTIYVSPTGVSGNPGTEASPKDIASVFDSDNLGANTTVILLDGTYTFTNDRYLWKKQGTASQPLIIKAKNKHMAILKGNSEYSSSRYAVLYLAGCKHVVIDGLTVMHDTGSNDQQSGINVATAVGSPAVNSEYVTIKNCKVYNHGVGGIVSSASDHITIEYNTVYGNATRSALNGSGISIYKPKALTSDNNYWGMIIRGNISYDNKCELDFYYNENGTIYQKDSPTDGNGIILDLFDNDGGNPKYGKRVLVENNLCYNNGGSGIKSYKSSLARIVNNTCYHNNTVLNLHGTTAQILVFETGGVNGVYNEGIYNNVVQTSTSLTTNTDYAMMVDFDMSKVYNNFLVGKGAKFNNYTYNENEFATSNTFNAATSQDAAKFQNVTNKNFKPKNNSPLLEKYTESYGPTVDILGTSRPQGTYTDLGCYEYIYVTNISLNRTTASIAAGATVTLTATVTPSTATYKNVNWTTNAAGVATVSSSGVVTGVAAGTAVISATTVDGSKVARCTITVTSTRVEAENGTLSGTVAYTGSNATISGYSGTGYVGSFDNTANTDKVTLTINAPSAGSYTLRIRYSACNITSNYVKVNSGTDVNTSFPTTGCSSWGNKDQTVTLNSGNNTVVIRKNNGSLNVDYIEITKNSAARAISTSSFRADALDVYPNPFSSTLNIPVIAEDAQTMSIKISTVTGQLIAKHTQEIANGQKEGYFDLSNLQSGFYILEVSQGDKLQSSKIFKQ